jgi:hypothetical protein
MEEQEKDYGAELAAAQTIPDVAESLPARVIPHPSYYVLEEMDERGWDRDRLAIEVVKARPDRDYGITRLAIDFFFGVGPIDPRSRMGELANDFGAAFGTSSELFTNLERSWLDSLAVSVPSTEVSSTTAASPALKAHSHSSEASR